MPFWGGAWYVADLADEVTPKAMLAGSTPTLFYRDADHALEAAHNVSEQAVLPPPLLPKANP
jgi:phenylpropionate dioxygenase-like ring-hydroxylating dioxygenase large terminal subunit